MQKKTDELFDNWLTDITNLTKNCHFGTLRESLIRDQIVIGTNDPTVQGRLLREAELDLPKAIQICKAAETASKQLKLLQSTSDKHVDFVNQKNTTFAQVLCVDLHTETVPIVVEGRFKLVRVVEP